MKVIFQSEKVFLSSTLKNNFSLPKSFQKLPFQKIKDDILGKNFEVSIILIGTSRSRFLNKTYRKKDYATDVLSFPFSPSLGEIFITPKIAEKKSKMFGMTFEDYLLFLVIHAFLHLKGYDHGVKMEAHERTYHSRYRCGHLRSTGCHRRTK